VKDRATMQYIIASKAGWTSDEDMTIWLQFEEGHGNAETEFFGISSPEVARALLVNLQQAFVGLEKDRLRKA
jgi:hypothetical protein